MDSREFARMHDKWLDPPDEPDCECECDHDECEDETCTCPYHERYDPRNEPEYYEKEEYYD